MRGLSRRFHRLRFESRGRALADADAVADIVYREMLRHRRASNLLIVLHLYSREHHDHYLALSTACLWHLHYRLFTRVAARYFASPPAPGHRPAISLR